MVLGILLGLFVFGAACLAFRAGVRTGHEQANTRVARVLREHREQVGRG
jgi:hypothetical protein